MCKKEATCAPGCGAERRSRIDAATCYESASSSSSRSARCLVNALATGASRGRGGCGLCVWVWRCASVGSGFGPKFVSHFAAVGDELERVALASGLIIIQSKRGGGDEIICDLFRSRHNRDLFRITMARPGGCFARLCTALCCARTMCRARILRNEHQHKLAHVTALRVDVGDALRDGSDPPVQFIVLVAGCLECGRRARSPGMAPWPSGSSAAF